MTRSKWSTLACVLSLFALSAWMCGRLFHTEFTRQTGSIESVFISFGRWMMDHWEDRSWMPLWMNGIPARQVYGPVLPTSVAWIALQTGWTPQLTYHALTAVTYCLGPVTLFWFIDRVTLRRGAALLAAALYSLLSPSALLFEAIRNDLGGFWHARRFETLVRYGEGPHVTGLMMIPLALWLVDRAATTRRWPFVLMAPVMLAVMVLTNWTTTTGFAMALAAYVVSKWGAAKYGDPPIHWPAFIGVGLVAYMLAAPWAPPSLIRTMQVASAHLSLQATLNEKVRVVACLAVGLLALHLLFQRFRVDRWIRFFTYFALITGVVVSCAIEWTLPLIPIGHRFHLEMEMALVGLAGILGAKLLSLVPRYPRYLVVALLLLVGVWQARHYRLNILSLSAPYDFTQAEEYKMGQWIGANLQGQRIFAPGATSQWMNLFSDVPQMLGCCDQSVLSEEVRMAGYLVYTGQGTSSREVELSTMWLRLYGVSAVGVQATPTSQLGQPYVNPKKFDGYLPEMWRDGDSAIYRVPNSGSLAHVVPQSALPSRHPVNGLDMEPLLPLHAAIELVSANATLKWLNQHEMEIGADTKPGDLIFLQETYDAGWHAYEGSRELEVSPNVLGLMTIAPSASGHHKIRMVYSGDMEDRITNAAFWIGAVLLVAWTYRRATT